MAEPIQLQTVDRSNAPANIKDLLPEVARSIINNAQLQDLISLIAGSGIVVLPAGKTWAEVKGFQVGVRPDGSAVVNTRY